LIAVSKGRRYAIYFVPAAQSELYRFGATLLGYDCYTGNDLAHAPPAGIIPAEWAELTREPRTYGFHATLKAPFRLSEGFVEADLVQGFQAFSKTLRPAPAILPSVEILDGFVAIVPQAHSSDVDALAADCVRDFDHFRAPMSADERARRLRAKLSSREQANVDRWGYPYVFNDFRFHMTLTGRLPANRQAAIRPALREIFSDRLGDRPIAIDGIALLCQPTEGARFRVIAHTFSAGG
jgi:putative phosphonate metabolism protein